jgi:ribosomal protein L25 (general stress protein Ctc)
MIAEGLVPGVIYGSDWPVTTANSPKQSIQMRAKDIKRDLRLLSLSLGNTLFELDVDGQSKELVIVKQLQICPRECLHVSSCVLCVSVPACVCLCVFYAIFLFNQFCCEPIFQSMFLLPQSRTSLCV